MATPEAAILAARTRRTSADVGNCHLPALSLTPRRGLFPRAGEDNWPSILTCRYTGSLGRRPEAGYRSRDRFRWRETPNGQTIPRRSCRSRTAARRTAIPSTPLSTPAVRSGAIPSSPSIETYAPVPVCPARGRQVTAHAPRTAPVRPLSNERRNIAGKLDFVA